MKKKGFTLIELLAVIVILAIIALIAIPLIGNVIEKAKIGALENSVNGLVESANMYYANQSIKGEQATETVFDFENGEQTSTEKLEYKGKVYNGKLILHANGEVALCIDDKEHYAYKNKDTDEIVSGIGTCVYDGTTGDFSSNSSINDLRGKTVVATNITQSADGLSALITIPEEGHYDTNSKISVSSSEVNSSLMQNITIYAIHTMGTADGLTNVTSLNIEKQYYSNMVVDSSSASSNNGTYGATYVYIDDVLVNTISTVGVTTIDLSQYTGRKLSVIMKSTSSLARGRVGAIITLN